MEAPIKATSEPAASEICRLSRPIAGKSDETLPWHGCGGHGGTDGKHDRRPDVGAEATRGEDDRGDQPCRDERGNRTAPAHLPSPAAVERCSAAPTPTGTITANSASSSFPIP